MADAATLTLTETVAANSFVDEASSHASGIPYYRTVARAIKSARPTNVVWLNPGTSTDAGYLEVGDVLVQFESPDAAFVKYTPPPYVVQNQTLGRCSMMVLQVSSAARMEAIVKKVRADGCGWVIVFDRTSSYTSPHVPAFWQQELLALKSDDDRRTGGACRDRFLSPFGSGSLWNTAIGSKALFVPANIYAPSSSTSSINAEGGPGPSKAQCANMTKDFAARHTCPGAHSGITAEQCAAKGCCFSNVHCNVPCPWCFTPQREFGPGSFHDDSDHFVAVKETDPEVTWWMQGWWGQPRDSSCVPSPANAFCHCVKLNNTLAFSEEKIRLPNFVKELNLKTANCNNALSMLQPDNRTVIQTQPAYRCEPGGPLFSLTNGTGPHGVGGPQTYP